jgi:uncharacterized protein YjdB
MTFLHKLAQRLARLWVAPVIGVCLMTTCKFPPARSTAPPDAVARLDLSPPSLSILTDRTADFVVVALTADNDTVDVSVNWTTNGGSIAPMSDIGGRKYARYRAPQQPGRYKVFARTGSSTVSDSSVVDVSTDAIASVSVTPSSLSLSAGQTGQLTATPRDTSGNPLTGRVVTWATNDGAVATVNGNGLVTAQGAGTATITATSEGQSGTAAITVTQPTVPVASVSVTPSNLSLTVGQTGQLTATPRDASGNPLTGRVVSWTTNSAAVATVNANGLVTAQGVGTATITATSEGKSGAATITVAQPTVPVTSVSVTPATLSLTVGQTGQLTATPRDASGNPLAGRVVTWTTSSAAVATVNTNGLVTARGAGTATITATSEGKSGTAAITVTLVPVASVIVSPATASILAGQTVQLTATPKDANGNILTGRVITWTSSNTGVATVNGTGLVTAVATGTAILTAACEGRNGTSAVTTNAPVASVTVSPATATRLPGQTIQLTATPKDSSGNPLTGRPISWGTSDAGVATVSGSGLVLGIAVGSATITASSGGVDGMSSVTVTASGGAWPNAPAGWTVVSDYDMHALNDGGWLNSAPSDITSGLVSVITDPTGPLNSTSWQFYFRKGDASICGAAPGTEYYLLGAPKQLYFGFWVKFSNPFSFPKGDPEVHAAYAFAQSGQIVLDMASNGDVYFVNEFPGFPNYIIPSLRSPSWSIGGWHQVEMLFDYAGTAKTWVDGVLTINATGVRYPNDAGFSQVEISPTWGGCVGETPAFDSKIWYNHVHIRTP